MQLYAEKANKTLKISESEKDTMIKQGFDVTSVDDEGKKTLVANGIGKTVPADDLTKANARIAELEKALAKAKAKPEKDAKNAAADPEKEEK